VVRGGSIERRGKEMVSW
jgi:hypothetical protein